jgi:putative transcriptional regulator
MAKWLRFKLMLTQEEFCERYLIPLGALRDSEQHRSEPDATAKAYLRAIRSAPDLIAELVKQKPAA